MFGTGPDATRHIEDAIGELAEFPIEIGTHTMQQAARVVDITGLFWLGELIEYKVTEKDFTWSGNALTEASVTGRHG